MYLNSIKILLIIISKYNLIILNIMTNIKTKAKEIEIIQISINKAPQVQFQTTNNINKFYKQKIKAQTMT